MNDNAPRSICLAILMIASIAVPLFYAHAEPPELRDSPVKMEGTINSGSCTGHDACRGTDAGNTYATAIDLSSDFDWDGTNETNIYFGSHPTATAYSSTSDDNNDFFIVDAPPGYGVTATLTWNHSGQGSYVYAETYAYRLHMGPSSMVGWSYSPTVNYGGAYAYCYYSNMGELKMTTENWEMYEGNPNTGTGYCYRASASYSTYTDTPHDVAGEPMMIGVSCYYCYQNAYDDYQLEITVWPGDAGLPGDQVQPLSGAPIAEIGGGWYWGTPYWSSVSDTFTISAGQSFDLNYECDYWCPYETAASLTAPNGTSYSWGVGSLASYSTGSLGSYSGAGTWTMAATDSWGDGGILLSAAEALGSFTGLLTADGFNPEDKASGNVGSTDTSDVWAMQIPDGYAANITLDWDANADLDIYIYQNSDLTGLLAYSWYDQPEYIDLGGSVTNTTVFVKVEYWYWGSVDPAAGYLLWMQITPSVDPPCWTQNDGGSGDDAGDTTTDATNVSSVGMEGTLTGMVCDGYDEYDYFLLDVPAYYGVWARLDWGADDGGGGPLYGYNHLWFYMYTETGSYIGGSTSTYRNPHALATNESYTWNYQLSSPSQVVLMVRQYDSAEDFELNYTIQYSMFNQSQEPTQSSNPNDAGSGQDAGDSTYGTDALVIQPMNQTFTGWAHDYFDRYDYYKVYMPNNYALQLNMTFPEQDWYYLGIYYPSATGYLYSACYVSWSAVQGFLSCSIDYSYGGQDVYIRVYDQTGGGHYSIDMTMITPDNEPGAPHNDCGSGVDASDNIYTNPGGNTWLNDSTQIDANGDANDTAGICTGWLDENWDTHDYYNILVPPGKYLSMNVTWPSDGQWVYTYMYKCQIQTQPCGYPSNPAYYVSQQSGSTGSTSGISGLWVTQGGWLTLGIYTYGASMITYTMDLQFRPLSELAGGVQDDAGSGVDAGAGPSDAVHVDDYNNWTANNTLEFAGWNHGDVDTTDRYTFDVPANYGYEVCVSHEGTQYYNAGYNVWIIMDIFGTGTGNIAYGQPIYSANTICWNSSTTGGYYGDAVNMIGIRNWAGYATNNDGQDYNVTISFFSLDADGDGWYDSMENLCGTDPYDNTSVPQDTDADGICDLLDTDTDGDGVIDSEDAFPEDANESSDSDGDGIGDNSDMDLDNDGWNNSDEVDCLTDPMDGSDFPADFDNDTICDVIDSDDDNDGYFDNDDRFPYNASEWADNDMDGVGDNADEDDDNDGYSDDAEIECMSNPLDVTDIPVDSDLDGICDAIDSDVDGDGYDNDVDAFPTDPEEWADFDGDGIGDNADTDDDNDLVLDVDDAFPYDPYETVDTDGDGVGDNSDLNDDGDAWTDAEEAACGSDSLDADSVPDDYDGDGLCDKVDTDDDGDGTPDTDDAFPFDATEYADFDGDGTGDFSDTDDDNDGWLDSEEPNCGTDPMDTFSVPDDNDRDHQCDIVDPDDDNDGTLDVDDDFPMNPAEQNDLDDDGYGDNADNDDDGDLWLDVTEAICAAAGGYGDSMNANVMPRDNDPGADATSGEDGIWGTDDDTGSVGDLVCDAIDPDWDNDGFPNPADPENPECTADLCEDYFPYDPGEWHDANGDGLGDNANELTFMDNFQAEPAPFIAAALAIIAMIVLVRRGMGSEEEDDFDEDADYTEEFLDDDEIDEAIDEAFDEDED